MPFYLRSGVYTMPEFLERRYGPACRWYLTTVSVLAYVFTKISVSLYAGALVAARRCSGGTSTRRPSSWWWPRASTLFSAGWRR